MFLAAVLLLASSIIPAPERDLAAAFPEGSLAVARAPAGRALWEAPPVQRVLAGLRASGALDELERGRAAIHLATGSDPADWLDFLLGGEIQAALYDETATEEDAPARRQLLLAARTPGAEGCRLALDAIVALLERDPARDVRRSRHREVPCTRIGRNLCVARHDEVLLVASTLPLLEDALDRLLDGATAVTEPPAATGLLDVRLDPALFHPRDAKLVAGPARRALGRRIANPLGNLLFGGLLPEAGTVHASLVAEETALELRIALPPVAADAPAAWFPPGAPGFAVPVSDQTMAVFAVRRDVADWWRHRESLLGEEAQAQLAKADETLSLLFMGASPAEDIFAGLREELALVVDRLDFPQGGAPAVRLPGACLVARMRDPATLGPAVQVAFQSLVGYLNTERAEQRRAAFLIDAVEHEGVTIRAARLVPGKDQGPPGMDANASPAVAVTGDWLFVGTSLEQVQRLLSALHAGTLRETTGGAFDVHVDGRRVMDLARDDREVLVANTMLEDGLELAAAAAQVDRLLGLAGLVRGLTLQATRADDQLSVRLRIEIEPPAAPEPPAPEPEAP